MNLNTHFDPAIRLSDLHKRLVSPLCGLVAEVGFHSPGEGDPQLWTCGAKLCDVHFLIGQPEPGPGGYHIGACGVTKDEALVKTLVESLERYAQLTTSRIKESKTISASVAQLEVKGSSHVNLKYLNNYGEEHGFFSKFNRNSILHWSEIVSISSGHKCFIPTQAFLLGYRCSKGEARYMPAVTTGTAAHFSPGKALLGSILELIQIDSAMGHWHGNGKAYRIIQDNRTESFTRLMKHSYQGCIANLPDFFLLTNPSFDVFTVACLFSSSESLPRFAIGLGVDLSLEKAMYKAFLEGYGVVGLARMLLLNNYSKNSQSAQEIRNIPCLDFDSNVVLYANDCDQKIEDIMNEKFFSLPAIEARNLPPDCKINASEGLRNIIEQARVSHVDFFTSDITNLEAHSCGVKVVRTWSPQLLALSLPGLPAKEHIRYMDYGGFLNDSPHPYP